LGTFSQGGALGYCHYEILYFLIVSNPLAIHEKEFFVVVFIAFKLKYQDLTKTQSH